jgi:DNA (cytosine-5)-methyltransferase 1
MENNNTHKKLKLKVFTAFSGYDSQCMALTRLKENYDWFDYELVGWSEIDEPAISSHNAIFPEAADRNLGDISKVDWKNVPDFDLFTYSSPCQDISICGQRRGVEAGSGTRSSLLWECQRTIEEKRPKYCILENVKALYTDKKFYPHLMRWKRIVNSYGYNSYIKILNSSDYDIPQGRERVFMVSIRNDVNMPDGQYYFPQPIERKRTISDFLKNDVSEEYYLSDDKVPLFLDLLYNTGTDFAENTMFHKNKIKNNTEDDEDVEKDDEEMNEECLSRWGRDSDCNIDDEEQRLMNIIGFVPPKQIEESLF